MIFYPGTGGHRNPEAEHRCIIVHEQDGNLYLVPICSARGPCDETCLLSANCGWDHIRHDSFVSYHEAKKVSKESTLNRMTGRNADIREGGRVPDRIFSDVVAGILISEETPAFFSRPFKPRMLKSIN